MYTLYSFYMVDYGAWACVVPVLHTRELCEWCDVLM